MNKKINNLIVLLFALVLSSCASDSGNTKLAKTNSHAIDSTFIKGKTTQQEVKAVFGDPDDTDIMVDGRVKWIFTHIKRSAMVRNYIPVVNWISAGTNDTTKKLVMVFKDGVLDDYSTSTSKGETKAGLIR